MKKIAKSIQAYLDEKKKEKQLKMLSKEIINLLNSTIDPIIQRRVMTVPDTMSLRDAAAYMLREHKGALVVLRRGSPAGVIRESDFCRPEISRAIMKKAVSEIIEGELQSIPLGTSLLEAQTYMSLKGIRKLPIVSRNRLAGILTQTDILKHLDSFAQRTIIDVKEMGLVRDVMSKKTILVPKQNLMGEAARLMKKESLEYLLVMDEEKPTGIVTVHDVLEEIDKNPDQAMNEKAGALMSSPLATISPDITVFEANKIMMMLERNFRVLPVMSDDRMIGVVTQGDILRGIFMFMQDVLKSIQEKLVIDIQVITEGRTQRTNKEAEGAWHQ